MKIDYLDYDFDNDSLFFGSNCLKYDISIGLGDLILDMGEGGRPIGLELLHASKHLGLSKEMLRNDNNVLKVNIVISEKTIDVKLSMLVDVRSKSTEKVSVLHSVNDENLQPGETLFTY